MCLIFRSVGAEGRGWGEACIERKNSLTRSNQSKSKMRVKLPMANVCIQQIWLMCRYRWYIDIATYVRTYIENLCEYIRSYDSYICIKYIVVCCSCYSLAFSRLFTCKNTLYARWMCWFACIMNEPELIGIFLTYKSYVYAQIKILYTFLFVCVHERMVRSI